MADAPLSSQLCHPAPCSLSRAFPLASAARTAIPVATNSNKDTRATCRERPACSAQLFARAARLLLTRAQNVNRKVTKWARRMRTASAGRPPAGGDGAAAGWGNAEWSNAGSSPRVIFAPCRPRAGVGSGGALTAWPGCPRPAGAGRQQLHAAPQPEQGPATWRGTEVSLSGMNACFERSLSRSCEKLCRRTREISWRASLFSPFSLERMKFPCRSRGGARGNGDVIFWCCVVGDRGQKDLCRAAEKCFPLVLHWVCCETDPVHFWPKKPTSFGLFPVCSLIAVQLH